MDNFLIKEKARVIARGDLQTTFEDIYAATLAAQTFRAIIAIMTHFDLESRQYDCHLAYLNAELPNPIYAKCPDGYKEKGRILKIKKALYSLKESENLWSKLLTKTLEELGLNPVPGINCLYTNGWLIFEFFVDDIYLVYPRSY